MVDPKETVYHKIELHDLCFNCCGKPCACTDSRVDPEMVRDDSVWSDHAWLPHTTPAAGLDATKPLLVTHPRMLLHAPPEGDCQQYPERPDRLAADINKLKVERLLGKSDSCLSQSCLCTCC